MQQLTDLALLVALVGTGLGAGVQATSHPRTWFADRRWLAVVLALNVLAYPVVAALLAAVLGLDAEARIGLILVSACAGGLLGLVVTRLVGGDLERAIVAVFLLELLNIITVPAWTTVLLASSAPVALVDVLRPLVLFLLLPVALGWLIQRFRASLAPVVVRVARPASTIALIVVVVLVMRENVTVFVATLGSGLPVAGVALLAVGMAAGWALGGPAPAARRTMAMVTAGHATALALAVARSAYGHQPEVEATIAVLGLIGLVVPIGIAVAWRAGFRTPARAVEAGS